MKEDKNLSEKEFGNTFEGKMDSEYILWMYWIIQIYANGSIGMITVKSIWQFHKLSNTLALMIT